MWLYLPLIFVLFGLHVYWFASMARFHDDGERCSVGVFWVNVIGFFLVKRWFGRTSREQDLRGWIWAFLIEKTGSGWTAARLPRHPAGLILFTFAYFSEHLLEQIFIVDFRCLFPLRAI